MQLDCPVNDNPGASEIENMRGTQLTKNLQSEQQSIDNRCAMRASRKAADYNDPKTCSQQESLR